MDLSRVSSSRFGTTWWREGYDTAEVDRLVNRLRHELRQEAPDVTADDVERTMFTAVRLRRGYKPRDVDQFLDEVVGHLRSRRSRG